MRDDPHRRLDLFGDGGVEFLLLRVGSGPGQEPLERGRDLLFFGDEPGDPLNGR
jgi:hypothetical protein